ncbi:MAG: class I SAM-dependent methyltransferase [Chitinophagales bacterium]
MKFQDNFSAQSALYARLRPQYPDALFSFLSGLTSGHELSWDVGCGNGQSALSLTGHYKQVIATDPSAEQIAHATQHEQIRYTVQRAEDCDLPKASVDLITAANALHWFDLQAFYPVAEKVLKPGGIFAAWCYGIPGVNESVDGIVRTLHDEVLGSFWVEANRLVENAYRDLYFPFPEIQVPAFTSIKTFDLHTFCDYLRTWSAVQKYIQAYGSDPLNSIENDLRAVWGDPETPKSIVWSLACKVTACK